MTISSQCSSAPSAFGSTRSAANSAGGRLRFNPALTCCDGALRTTFTPARFADCANLASTFTAERSKPETSVKSSMTQAGRGSVLSDSLRSSARAYTLPKKT